MKKLLLMFALVSMLVFGLATSALASTAYLDYFSGDLDLGAPIDATGFTLGVNGQVDKFYLGLDYGTFEDDLVGVLEITILDISGGYLLIDDENTKLAVGLGYTDIDFMGLGLSGFALAVDVSHNVDNFLFEGGLGYGLNVETDGGAEFDTLSYSLRFSYLFNECYGVALGYRSYTLSPAGADFDLAGVTLGVTYKF